ncbi:MAG TPA: polysaccharide biosynthesis protein [Micromonosporaceae bacterium]|nr:polysaccharide biosynthesis protein [Micromonosporaceae bacterium]
MTPTTSDPAPVRLGASGAAVTVAAVLTNALAYLVPMLGARQLDAGDLSALATALGLAAIAGVPGLGLQLAIAVHHARHGRVPTGRVAAMTAALSAGALVVATPVLTMVLRLPAQIPALLAVTTAAVVLAARWLGQLQGEQRFLRLAVAMALLAAGRYGGVIAGLALDAGLTGSLAAGAGVAALSLPFLAWLAAPVDKQPPPAGPDERQPLRASQVLTGCSATLAMLVVSYADLILARQLLPAAESGAYAVGTVLTKGALWAPQVVTVLALPRLARGDRGTRRVALALTAGCGLVLVAAAALAGGLAFRLAGGASYAHLGGYAPAFAATGALYALVFVLLNARVAAGVRRPAAPLWVAAAGLIAAALFVAPHTYAGVMWSALITAALATAAMIRPVGRRAGATVGG